MNNRLLHALLIFVFVLVAMELVSSAPRNSLKADDTNDMDDFNWMDIFDNEDDAESAIYWAKLFHNQQYNPPQNVF